MRGYLKMGSPPVCAILVAFLLLTQPDVWADDTRETARGEMLDSLRHCFQRYYTRVGRRREPQSERRPIREVVRICAEGGFLRADLVLMEEEVDLGGLTDFLNAGLRDEGKCISLFATTDAGVVNCWLGDLIEQSTRRETVWGEKIQVEINVVGNLLVSDYVDFSTGHKEALDVGVRGNTIYYNLDAIEMRARGIWSFLVGRSTGRGGRYDPSRLGRLRKRLCILTWRGRYLDHVERHEDWAIAKTSFVAEAVDALRRNSLFHELGHVYARDHLGILDEVEDETVAFLTELRYGVLPYESIDVLVSSRWRNSLTAHRKASDEVLLSFLSFIETEGRKGESAYGKIGVRDSRLRYTVEGLYELTPEQIREIADHIFEGRYAGAVSREGIGPAGSPEIFRKNRVDSGL